MSERHPQSFPKRARLRRRRDFLRLQHEGRRRHTEHFVVLIAPAAETTCRVGMTVSSRVGNAVTRNRVKRLLREVMRRAWRTIEPAADIAIIAKPGAAKTTYAEAAVEIGRALRITAD